MSAGKNLRKEFVAYLKSNGIGCSLVNRRDNVVYLDPFETGSFYFNTGVYVSFDDNQTARMCTTGNVRLASADARSRALAAIKQQNASSLAQFRLTNTNSVIAEAVEQVQPGSVGETFWQDVIFMSHEVEGFLLDIEELLDPESYTAALTTDDQQELEEMARRFFRVALCPVICRTTGLPTLPLVLGSRGRDPQR